MSENVAHAPMRAKPSWRTPRRAVSALFLYSGIMLGLWATRIPNVTEKFALSPRALSLVLLSFALGVIVALLFSGRIIEKYGEKPLSLIGMSIGTFFFFLIPLIPNLPLLIANLLLCGAGFGLLDVSMNAWGGGVEHQLKRPVMASFHGMFSLGAVIGAIAGYFALSWSWSMGAQFWIFGGVAFVLAFLAAQIPWQSAVSESQDQGPLLNIPKGPLALVGIFVFCGSIGEGGMIDWSALYMIGAQGATESEAARAFAIFSAAMVAMRFAGDAIIAKFGPVRTGRMAGISVVIGSLTCVFTSSYTVALIGFVFMGLGYALAVPLAFSRAAHDDTMPAGRAIASVSTLGYSGMLFGPVIVGWVVDAFGLRAAYALFFILALFIVAFAKTLKLPKGL